MYEEKPAPHLARITEIQQALESGCCLGILSVDRYRDFLVYGGLIIGALDAPGDTFITRKCGARRDKKAQSTKAGQKETCRKNATVPFQLSLPLWDPRSACNLAWFIPKRTEFPLFRFNKAGLKTGSRRRELVAAMTLEAFEVGTILPEPGTA